MADVNTDVTLKNQYDLIQQRTQQNLANRKKKKEEKEKRKKENTTIDTSSSVAFGIDDDLDLKLADPPAKSSLGVSEELVEHLNQQIRELKDETGRLYKLLSERDLENRQLRKKHDQQKSLSAAGGGNLSGDAAALKIVELSKKVRELTAELESEKSKSKQWAKKCYDLENERNISGDGVKKSTIYSEDVSDKQNLQNELQTVQDRLRHTEQRTSEYRNQCQSLRQELKMAHKVLANEVGEGANIQALLNAPSGWRGRSQQIMTLQKKVHELKSQVEAQQMGSRADFDLEESFMGSSIVSSATSRRSMALDERNREQIRKIDKEKREANERLANDVKALEQDYENMKSKWEASKARNKVLSTEIKSYKQQISTLLEKGKHDDELIEALMKQQAQLKTHLDTQTAQQKDVEKMEEERKKGLVLRQQQESNVIEQLKTIVTEKEAKVKKLQDEISNMRLTRSQMNGVQAIFDESPRWAVPGTKQRPASASTLQDSPPAASARGVTISSARYSERSVSRQRTLLEENQALTDRPPSTKPPSARRRNSSVIGDHCTSQEDLQLQCQEFHSLYQATQVERDRMRELIQVLEKRAEEATSKMLASQTELQSQKRKNVQLEKQLGKANMEQGSKLGAKKSSATGVRLRAAPMDSLDEEFSGNSMSLEELQTNLEIQRDENEALKMALQRTLKAKEEDLKLYNEIMEETKDVFLQGLKQYKQKTEK